MGNVSMARSSDGTPSYVYGSATQQVNGVLALKKERSPNRNNPRGSSSRRSSLGTFSLSSRIRGEADPRENKTIRSVLMKSILSRDWQRVLIRARLHPHEVSKSSTVVVPVPHATDRVRYYRTKLLPVHVACALGPPPEVVKALLSHAVVVTQEKRAAPNNALLHDHRLLEQPLYHEDNTSLATISVEAVGFSNKNTWITRSIRERFSRLRKKVTEKEKRCRKEDQSSQGRSHVSDSGYDEGDDTDSNSNGLGWDEEQHQIETNENDRDVALFLRQMEDHLAQNGRCARNDGSKGRKKKSSIFVLDFDPSSLIPSPSAVRASEKQDKETIHNNHHDLQDLVSLENSIGDMDTAMTTTTQLLEENDNESSSRSLEYLADGDTYSSLAHRKNDSKSHDSPIFRHSSVPNSRAENNTGQRNGGSVPLLDYDGDSDSDSLFSSDSDTTDDNSSFLQLTSDGRLASVHLHEPDEVHDGISKGTKPSDDAQTRTHKAISTDGNSSDLSASLHELNRALESIQINTISLLEGLPRTSGKEQPKNKDGRCCRILPLHVACLYGASPSVLRILLEEYPDGSSIEVDGMMPVHMIAANWSLSNAESCPFETEANRDREWNGDDYEDGEFQKDRLQVFVEHDRQSLMTKSSAHGLIPIDYFKTRLRHIGNKSDTNLMQCINYLESMKKPRRPPCGNEGDQQDDPEISHKPEAIDLNSLDDCDKIDTVSTCTTNASTSFYEGGSSINESSPKQSSLGELLNEGLWEDAMSMLETDLYTSRMRTSLPRHKYPQRVLSAGSEWAGLPIHVVCNVYNTGTAIVDFSRVIVPIGLVQLLVSSYPDGPKQMDSSGSLPLHLICDSFRRPQRGLVMSSSAGGEEHRVFTSSRLQVLQLLLKCYPFATNIRDKKGRLPLHRAILANAPIEAIQLLVFRDPRAIACADKEGITPFTMATRMNSTESHVVNLLRLAWV